MLGKQQQQLFLYLEKTKKNPKSLSSRLVSCHSQQQKYYLLKEAFTKHSIKSSSSQLRHTLSYSLFNFCSYNSDISESIFIVYLGTCFLHNFTKVKILRNQVLIMLRDVPVKFQVVLDNHVLNIYLMDKEISYFFIFCIFYQLYMENICLT